MAANSREIELKLSCTPASARALAGILTALCGHKPRRQKLVNTYFDTADLRLRAEGIALRIRSEGKSRLQTVKCSGEVAGGMSSRPEWEQAYRGDFDFDGVDDIRVRTRLRALHAQDALHPTLATDFERLSWVFKADGAEIHIMLDRGRIQAGGKEEPICELELEIASGPPEALYRVAAYLGEAAALFPAPLSKAARGSRLLAPASVATLPATPSGTASTAEALHQLLRASFDRITTNLPTNVAHFGADHIHEIRVGLRQLRTLLRAFEPQFLKPWFELATAGAEYAMEQLGAGRDIDVLQAEIVAPAREDAPPASLKRLEQALAAEAEVARKAALDLLHDGGFGSWLLICDIGLHGNQAVRPKHRFTNWKKLSHRTLRQMLAEYTEPLAHAKKTPPALHRLRIRTKRVAYMLANTPASKPLLRLQEILDKLRKQLGRLQDLHAAGEVLTRIATDDPGTIPAIAAIGKWHKPRHAELMQKITANRAKATVCLKLARGRLE